MVLMQGPVAMSLALDFASLWGKSLEPLTTPVPLYDDTVLASGYVPSS